MLRRSTAVEEVETCRTTEQHGWNVRMTTDDDTRHSDTVITSDTCMVHGLWWHSQRMMTIACRVLFVAGFFSFLFIPHPLFAPRARVCSCCCACPNCDTHTTTYMPWLLIQGKNNCLQKFSVRNPRQGGAGGWCSSPSGGVLLPVSWAVYLAIWVVGRGAWLVNTLLLGICF